MSCCRSPEGGRARERPGARDAKRPLPGRCAGRGLGVANVSGVVCRNNINVFYAAGQHPCIRGMPPRERPRGTGAEGRTGMFGTGSRRRISRCKRRFRNGLRAPRKRGTKGFRNAGPGGNLLVCRVRNGHGWTGWTRPIPTLRDSRPRHGGARIATRSGRPAGRRRRAARWPRRVPIRTARDGSRVEPGVSTPAHGAPQLPPAQPGQVHTERAA